VSLGTLPDNVTIETQYATDLGFIHFSAKSKSQLRKEFPKLKSMLSQEKGMLWISWPKGASGLETDLNENVVITTGLENGLVDVKIAA
jgi:hypothetical protein